MLSFDEWSELTDGYDVPVIAALCKMHRTTIKRIRERGRVPYVLERFLRAELHGELPAIAGAWSGWRVGRDGLLYAPDLKNGFTPGEIKTLVWWRQMNTWRAACARLAIKSPTVSRQPLQPATARQPGR